MYSEQPAVARDAGLDLLSINMSRPSQSSSARYSPYERVPSKDPNAPGKWGHDLFRQEVLGGNLFHRDTSSALARFQNSGRLGKDSNLGVTDLLDPGLDLRGNGRKATGAGAALAARLGGGGAGAVRVASSRPTPLQPRRAVSAAAVVSPAVVGSSSSSSGGMRSDSPSVASPGISIKGKSGKTTVEVANLITGTTAEDVKMIFESFGTILSAKQVPSPRDSTTVHIEFATYVPAQQACSQFDNQLADGRILSVKIYNTPASTSSSAPPLAPSSSRPSAAAAAAAAARAAPPPKAPAASRALDGLVLASRLGLPATVQAKPTSAPAPFKGGDLLDRMGSSSSKMYSDALEPSPAPAAVSSLSARIGNAAGGGGGGGGGGRSGARSNGRRGGGRNGGRGAQRGVGAMDVD